MENPGFPRLLDPNAAGRRDLPLPEDHASWSDRLVTRVHDGLAGLGNQTRAFFQVIFQTCIDYLIPSISQAKELNEQVNHLQERKAHYKNKSLNLKTDNDEALKDYETRYNALNEMYNHKSERKVAYKDLTNGLRVEVEVLKKTAEELQQKNDLQKIAVEGSIKTIEAQKTITESCREDTTAAERNLQKTLREFNEYKNDAIKNDLSNSKDLIESKEKITKLEQKVTDLEALDVVKVNEQNKELVKINKEQENEIYHVKLQITSKDRLVDVYKKKWEQTKTDASKKAELLLTKTTEWREIRKRLEEEIEGYKNQASEKDEEIKSLRKKFEQMTKGLELTLVDKQDSFTRKLNKDEEDEESLTDTSGVGEKTEVTIPEIKINADLNSSNSSLNVSKEVDRSTENLQDNTLPALEEGDAIDTSSSEPPPLEDDPTSNPPSADASTNPPARPSIGSKERDSVGSSEAIDPSPDLTLMIASIGKESDDKEKGST